MLTDLDAPFQSFSADNVPATNSTWISDCWSAVRSLKQSNGWENVVLVIEAAYIGSANLTGAGIGMKSCQKRTFEAGILTNEPSLVNAAANQFDDAWRGAFCGKMRQKKLLQ